MYTNVSRLMYIKQDGGNELAGTVCLLRFGGRILLLTARHCLDTQPGEPIGDLRLTAFGGCKLR